ncbi:hypothetical protein GLOIN_2v1762590 [Rhizophagus irregularis DAOM 181602=DAOM 197198]|nr:hypothetical protein GLOIN_2v1762590 [Rhizophagus irregularis DAOM 181602=DAOM 197198]
MRLIVTVKEGVEDIVKPNLIKVDDYYFESLFHKITLDAYRQKNLKYIAGWMKNLHGFKICSLADYSVAPRRNALDLIIWLDWWITFIKDLYKLIEMVKKYMIYLEQVNNSMNKLHKSLEPARNGIENIMVKIIEACNQSDSIYDDLNFAISNLEDYKYINIERYLPEQGIGL